MPKLTPARAQAQRARILEAALRCFARDGFQGATMQDIVAESGLSPGAIYGYFEGKSEIVAAIAAERHAMDRRQIESALASGDLSNSLAQLVGLFTPSTGDAKEGAWRHLAVQLWAESLADRKLRRETLKGVTQSVDLLAPLIERAQQEGRWPTDIEASALARVMIAILQGVSLQLAWDKRLDMASIGKAAHALFAGMPARTETSSSSE